MCSLLSSIAAVIKAVRPYVLKLFSVAVISVLFLAGPVSIFATKFGSIVIALSMVTATCLLKVVMAKVRCIVSNNQFLTRKDMMRQPEIEEKI